MRGRSTEFERIQYSGYGTEGTVGTVQRGTVGTMGTLRVVRWVLYRTGVRLYIPTVPTEP